jgi:hypothetical protein
VIRAQDGLNRPRPYIGAPDRLVGASLVPSGEVHMQPRATVRVRLAWQNRVEVASCTERSCPHASQAGTVVSWSIVRVPGDWPSKSVAMSNDLGFADRGRRES